MVMQPVGQRPGIYRLLGMGAVLTLLSACMEGDGEGFFSAKPDTDEAATAQPAAGGGKTRIVESPNVFGVTDRGLWDGRPSLGGIWVAHPDVLEPHQVIIRNTANSKSVKGALFRRERVNPGPAFQVSSDAADALGMLAGAPAELKVVALVKEVIEPDPPAPEAAAEDETPAVAAAPQPPQPPKTKPKARPARKPATVETTPLDPIAGAAAAIDAAVAEAAGVSAPEQKSNLLLPYILAGKFENEVDARAAAAKIENIGLVPDIREKTGQSSTVWRVVVGPFMSRTERTSAQQRIKGLGYGSVTFVRN